VKGVTYLQLNTLDTIINIHNDFVGIEPCKGGELLIISISSEILKLNFPTILLSSILFARYHSLMIINNAENFKEFKCGLLTSSLCSSSNILVIPTTPYKGFVTHDLL
jgi:hypothetical protein